MTSKEEIENDERGKEALKTLKNEFKRAVDHVSESGAGLYPNSLLLQFYGLYKRATVGPPNPSLRPSYFAFSARAKYDAWLATGDMEIPRAMALYIQLVVETISGPEPMPDPTELGHAVSSMAQPEDELEDDLVCSYAKTGNIDLLRKAAEQDDSLNDKVNDETGMTPLFFAVDRGHEAVVNFLLDKGAKINRQDLIGQTCLHVAAASGREILYNILVERGGDESVVDEDGLKPLDLFQ